MKAYFVNFASEYEHAIYTSELDDLSGTWSERQPITIDGIIDKNAVDPDITVLESGLIALTFMRGRFELNDNPEDVPSIYTAWSYDGVNFHSPNKLYQPSEYDALNPMPPVTDPALLQLADSSYLLAVSFPSILGAKLYHLQTGGLISEAEIGSLNTFSPDLRLNPTSNKVEVFFADGSVGGVGRYSATLFDDISSYLLLDGNVFSGAVFDPNVFSYGDDWAVLLRTNTSSNPMDPLNEHQTMLAISSDGGESFVISDYQVLNSASVPAGVDLNLFNVDTKFTAALSTDDVLNIGGLGAWADGGVGIDKVIIDHTEAVTELFNEKLFSNTFTVKSSENNSLYILENIERIEFLDANLALDLDGRAGQAAKILGAVFGKEAVSNKQYAGIGLHFLDSGVSYEALTELAINAALGDDANNHSKVVKHLYKNVLNVEATDSDAEPFVQMLEAGMTIGALGVLAAETSYNTVNIDLVGLQETGLAYELFEG